MERLRFKTLLLWLLHVVEEALGIAIQLHQDDRLKVTLEPPKAGQTRMFWVNYRGVPASGLRIGPNKFKERTFFSDNWPDKARQWLEAKHYDAVLIGAGVRLA